MRDEMKVAASGALAGLVVFAVIFAVNFVFVAPFQLSGHLAENLGQAQQTIAETAKVRIWTQAIPTENDDFAYATRLVIFPATATSPTRLIVAADKAIGSGEVHVAGGVTVGGAVVSPLDPKMLIADINMPGISPQTPVEVVVYSDEKIEAWQVRIEQR